MCIFFLVCHVSKVYFIAADRVVNEYNNRLEKLEREYKSKDVMELGVSYQPGFKQFPVGKYKQAYFSGVDW